MKLLAVTLIIVLSSLVSNAQKKGGLLIMDQTYLIVNKTHIKLETWNVVTANRILDAIKKGKIRLKKFSAESKKNGTLYDLYFSHDDFFELQSIIKQIDSATQVNQ